ncbi:hypothetical protein C3L33_07502, partial [Rhododendron williamsianum]
MVTPRSRVQTKPTRFSSKKNVKKRIGAIIRRSDRLRNVTPPAQNREIEPVVEEINLCESEKEDDPHVEETPPESMLPEESLEEKTDYPAGGLKLPRGTSKPLPSLLVVCYNYYYLISFVFELLQNEALTKENYELSKNLAVAMGKIEGLAESSRVCSGLLGKLQDVLLISNLGKATETAMNLSSQAVLCRCSPSGVGDPKVAVKKKAKGVGDPKVAVKKKAKGPSPPTSVWARSISNHRRRTAAVLNAVLLSFSDQARSSFGEPPPLAAAAPCHSRRPLPQPPPAAAAAPCRCRPLPLPQPLAVAAPCLSHRPCRLLTASVLNGWIIAASCMIACFLEDGWVIAAC